MKGAKCSVQNSEIVVCNLSKQATKADFKFDRLYRHLYNKDFYYKAYAKIYKNDGSTTKGIDDETADGFGENKIEQLIKLIKTEKYIPKSVRRTHIRKKNGKLRPLGIPSFSDRIIQEICRRILETIYEPVFSDSSHGFRPNRSCHTALTEIKETFTAVNWFVEGDIKAYFDTMDHHILIEILRNKIQDERFIRLIWKFLRAGYMQDWKYHKTYSGTPQGGIISPILANIYLNEFDNYVAEVLKKEFDTGKAKTPKRVNKVYRRASSKLARLKKKIDGIDDQDEKQELIKFHNIQRKTLLSIPYYESCDNSYKRLKYVRYADDFIIGINGSKRDCELVKKKIKIFLKDRLNLEMSDEKTLITYSVDGSKFLGYQITVQKTYDAKKDKNGIAKRVHNGRIRLTIPSGTIEKVIIKNKLVTDINNEPWQTKHRPALIGLTDLEIIQTYNSELRGLYNYYGMAQNVSSKMWQLKYVMEYSCLKTLACKYKSTVAKMRSKYRKGKYWGVNYETKTGTKTTFYYNKGFKIQAPSYFATVDNKPNLYVYQCTTELEKRLKACVCEICGTNNEKVEYEVHHVNRVKNLKGKAFWEKIMIAKKRKTLVVCEPCHKKIHKG